MSPETADTCACGCGGTLEDSLYWSSDLCYSRWLAKVNGAVSLPDKPVEPPPVVRALCGTTYTETAVETT